MTVYAYLRVSTDAQDTANQRHGILEFANARGLAGLKFIEDSASGRIPWKERKLGEIMSAIGEEDTLIFAEVSRIARSTLGVLEVLKEAQERGASVLIAKQKMEFDDSMNSKITAVVLGLAAEIEREFISLRTKEALAKKKSEGVKLGRPKGRAESVKLDNHDKMIRELVAKGVSKRDIARIVECSPSTLYDWLDRRGIRIEKRKAA